MTNDNNNGISLKLRYKEGSEACRNYSRLTMKVRTLSQHVLIIYVVGISILLFKETGETGNSIVLKEYLKDILFGGGIILYYFGISLALVDWHYQSAFQEIRNSLVRMEDEGKEINGNEVRGPWTAHKKIRTHANDHLASYFPFGVLLLIGFWCSFYGYSAVTCIGFWLLILCFPVALIIGVWFWFGRRKQKGGGDKKGGGGCKGANVL